jgi:cobyrinic acid a,c-diamide synthase
VDSRERTAAGGAKGVADGVEGGALSTSHTIPRIAIAAAASGAGKTTIAAGLIAALHRQGLIVQSFKCGPDYIDPSYHTRAAHRACRNLDAWMLNDHQLIDGFSRAAHGADAAVIEGVMGLFDGSNWQDERASTAQIAKLLKMPVLLVVDIAGAARSAAAVVLGCQHFDPAVDIRGAVLNFAGSEGHAKGCAQAITAITGLPVLGWLPREPALQIPERHLGLVPGGENLDADVRIATIAEAVEQRFDLTAIMQLAQTAGELQDAAIPATQKARAPRGPTLAVARDDAFCFYYPENLELLEEAGAQVEYFSPLRGEVPSDRACGIYLGGGYPELQAARLAANSVLWNRLRRLHEQDAPIYAECGGFMALTNGLIDRDGQMWPMGGLVPGVTRMTDKIAALGYRHAVARHANLLSDPGEELRGHEFRYSRWETDAPVADSECAWQLRGSHAEAPVDSGGFARGNLLASYVHIHFGQRADLADRFVAKLSAVRRG